MRVGWVVFIVEFVLLLFFIVIEEIEEVVEYFCIWVKMWSLVIIVMMVNVNEGLISNCYILRCSFVCKIIEYEFLRIIDNKL